MNVHPLSNIQLQSDHRLTDMALGEKARIGGFTSSEVEIAMLKLGIRVGDPIILTGKAPFGGPFAIGVKNTKVSLRKDDAARIWIIKSLPTN